MGSQSAMKIGLNSFRLMVRVVRFVLLPLRLGRLKIARLWLLSLLFSSQAVAEMVNVDVYREPVQIPVAWLSSDGPTKSWQPVLADALANVFLRVTGSRTLLNDSEIQSVLKTPEKYLIRYSTLQQSNNPNASLDSNKASVLLSFDSMAINRVLAKLDVPIWGELRPKILVWWVIEENGVRSVLSEGEELQREGLLEIQAAAGRWGIPIQVPIMDIEDQAWVTPATIVGFMLEELHQGAIRYNTQYLLVGKTVKDRRGNASSSWHWATPSGVYRGERVSADEEALFEAVFAGTSELMARQFAIRQDGSNATQLLVEVSNVHSLGSFAALTELLTGLPGVDLARLNRLNLDSLCYALDLRIDLDQFQRMVSQSRRMIPAFEGERARRFCRVHRPSTVAVSDRDLQAGGADFMGDQGTGEPDLAMPESDREIAKAPTPVLRYEWYSRVR